MGQNKRHTKSWTYYKQSSLSIS